MYVDEEQRRYGDLTILEPIVEQQDDEIPISPISNSSIGTNYPEEEEERRAREEIQQFEKLEKEFASHRRGIRVKFDDERFFPITRTTLIKTEPCFQVNSSEDQVTKHFYHNEYQSKDENNQSFGRQITLSEPNSLEQEYVLANEENDEFYEPNASDKEIPDLSSSSSKSILKKAQTRETILVPKPDRSSRSRSPSPSSSTLKKKQTSSNRVETNEVQHLAEVTAKQTTSQTLPSSRRSLFEPTTNIFDTSNLNTRRPSRLRYYIKPYRGEPYIPPNINKQQPKSILEQRFAQPPEPTVWYTFSNQYSRPLNRRQHVSWSPVREYIHQGRDNTVKAPTKKKELFLSPLPTRSSSNPCLRSSSPSMIPISIRYRSSQNPQSFLPSSIDSYETASTINYSLTPNSQYEEKKGIISTSALSDITPSQKKDHNETIQRYDRLLEKMRTTDEQLQRLSRSWTNNMQQKTSHPSNLLVNKKTNNNEVFSPMVLQICLIILVLFNLLVIYFFNDINILWSRYIVTHSELTD